MRPREIEDLDGGKKEIYIEDKKPWENV